MKRAVIVSVCLTLIGLLLVLLAVRQDHRFYKQYQRIQIDMTLREVENILGPSEQLSRDEIPRTVDDSQPEFSKRLIPVVKGDTFHQWKYNGQTIIVGVVQDRVVDKWYQRHSL